MIADELVKQTMPYRDVVMPREDRKSGAAYAASQHVSEAEALTKGMEEKAAEFKQAGAEVYRKA